MTFSFYLPAFPIPLGYIMTGTNHIKHLVIQRLHRVIDPELGINIVDLGLIYAIQVNARHVHVEYTLTTPGCPMGRLIQNQIESQLHDIDEVEYVETMLVWDPPWSTDMISKDVELFA